MKTMDNKKIVYVDMDGVLCDFYNIYKKQISENPEQAYPQSRWGFFLSLPEIKDAIDSINKLKEQYDVWILTRPSTKNVNCYTEKAQWIWNHLGYDMVEKLILSPNKTLLKGDYLIDDHHWDFDGELILFGSEKYPDWLSVIKYLIK